MSSEEPVVIESHVLSDSEFKEFEEEEQRAQDPEEIAASKRRKRIAIIVAVLAAIVLLILACLLLRSCSNSEDETPTSATAPITGLAFDSADMTKATLGTTIDYGDYTISTSRPVDVTDPKQPYLCTSVTVTVKNDSSNTQPLDWNNSWVGVTSNGDAMNTSYLVTEGFNEEDVDSTFINGGDTQGVAFTVAPSKQNETFYALVFAPEVTSGGHPKGIYWIAP